ncbi:MAG: hypothetical protein WA902_06020, partial [Thermosynechococcaceae cyanobacterium]
DIYSEKRSRIQREIEASENNSEIVEIVQRELQKLADIKGEYIGNLTKSQARIALSMLEAFRTSFVMLEKGQRPVSEPYQYTTDAINDSSEEESGSPDNLAFDLADLAVTGACAAGGAMVAGPPGAAVGAAGGTVVSSVFKKATRIPKERNKVDIHSSAKEAEVNQSEATLDTLEILRYLEQAFDVIDQTVTEYGRISEPVVHKPQIEDHPEVLKFIQDLMGEIQSFKNEIPPIFQARLREISSILRKYGIRSQIYQEDASEQIKELFEYETSLDDTLKNETMLTPAFLRDGKLLIPGRVLKPSGE